jgi:hypothetical protein
MQRAFLLRSREGIKVSWIPLFSALLFAFCLLAAGCSSSGSSTNVADVAGNWQITLQGPTATYSQSGFLLQSGKSVNSQFLLSGSCAGVGAVQGQTENSSVSLTVNQPAQIINLSGAPDANGSSLSGSYSILTGGCGASEVGTWAAIKVAILTGSFTGTFVSSASSVAPVHFSGNVTQGQNVGASSATLAGSMTSNDAVCFRDASISGMISGTSALFTLTSPQGMALGQFSGQLTSDATSAMGTYDFFNAQTPIPGCPHGDSGTATLAIHPAQ